MTCSLERAALGLALAGLLVLGACRRGMEQQPKLTAYQESDFFQDGRSVRSPVAGTVARGELHADTLFYSGQAGGKDSEVFPYPPTEAMLKRGRQRYDIYCSACHDRAGTGNGMVVRRGFPRPPSLHSERLRRAPPGHFFDVMTRGFGRMYPYAERVSAADRWAIAAYIRALQLSQHAALAEVPAAERAALAQQAASASTSPAAEALNSW